MTVNDSHAEAPVTASTPEVDLSVVDEEQQILGRVLAHLDAIKPAAPPPTGDYEQQLLELREEIAVSRIEDQPALIQQMERLSGIAARRADNVIEPVDRASPYFGHLRLREDGKADRDVLIGKTTLIDGKANVRIVDWRHAPVSQLYYRYEQGAEYDETFGEREVSGEVLVRRTVTIDQGELIRVAAPEGTFVKGQSGAWRSLSVQATELAGGQGVAVRPGELASSIRGGFQTREDRHLPDVSALLDPRQFELISKPEAGIIAIQGGAGSGKTTIGVHRMAYLAFNAKQRFTADKMLVIVGSPALRAYISEVLPALGIGGVRIDTFAEWATDMRRRAIPWLEAGYEENTPSVVTRYKTHPAMMRLFQERAKHMNDSEEAGGARVRRDSRGVIWLWAETLTDLEAAQKAFAAVGDPELGPDQVKQAWRWCTDHCQAIIEADPGDRAERLAAEGDGEGPRDVSQDGGGEERVVSDERAKLDPEDDALLLRAHQLLRGELRRGKQPLEYEHLFVDEAQDLAAVELAVLLGVVTKRRSVTLAGDTAQRLHMNSGFRDWRQVLDDLGLRAVDVEPLRIAYRSTAEVLHLARAVLGPLADPEPPVASRHGAPVEHHHFPSPGAAVAFMAEALRPLFVREPRATVAILARHPEQADVYYEALKMAEVPHLRRVRSYEFAFKPGVEVTDVRQVKGLEYDYVVLVDVNRTSYPGDDESRYLLHIGATRAAHQLWLISTSEPSPLIPRDLVE